MIRKPFENESEALTIGDLTAENRLDRLTLYGRLDLTRDKAGLEAARALKALLDAAVTVLEADTLPDKVKRPKAPKTVKNPFG
jgi:hypothetical protein